MAQWWQNCDSAGIVILVTGSGSAQSSATAVFVDTGAEWSKSHIMIFIGAIILGIIVHSGAFNPSKTAVPAASFIIP